MSEKTITEAEVREEHLKDVHVRAHWLYIASVLGGSFVLMLGFLWFLGGGR